MESISSGVKQILGKRPFLLEGLEKNIINYGNLALLLKPEIENALGRQIKESAVMMALRRYADELQRHLAGPGNSSAVNLTCEIVMKTNICDFNVKKSAQLPSRIGALYQRVSFERGDFLNIVIGNNEISIAVSDRYLRLVEEFLQSEEVLHRENGLVALTLLFTGDFFNTPGIVFQVTRRLAWEHINVYEIVSTLTELTVIIHKNDSIKGYEVMQGFIETTAASLHAVRPEEM